MYCSGASRRRRVENSIKSILNKYSLTPGLHWEIKLLNISDILMWRRLQLSRRTLQDYRNNGVIPYIQLGGKILYREFDIQKILMANYREAYRMKGV